MEEEGKTYVISFNVQVGAGAGMWNNASMASSATVVKKQPSPFTGLVV